jgi:hypothetical protein
MKILCIILMMTAKLCLASYPLESSIWKTNTIPVCWETTDNPEGMETVRNALKNSWEQISLVRFTEWHKCTDDFVGVRLTSEDSNPRTVFLGHSEHMSWFKQPNAYVNFTFKTWYPECPLIYTEKSCIEMITVHEFGHILGFAHDQNRPDKPFWCAADQYAANGNALLLNYDQDSVMNYCNTKWNGLGTLSTGDILTAQAYYGNLPSLEASTGVIEITDTQGFKATMQDIMGNGEYIVTACSKTKEKSILPQEIKGDILTIPLGKFLQNGSVKGLYKSTMQRLKNGNWVFVDIKRINI